jgi:hypothetical protein
MLAVFHHVHGEVCSRRKRSTRILRGTFRPATKLSLDLSGRWNNRPDRKAARFDRYLKEPNAPIFDRPLPSARSLPLVLPYS